MCKKKIKIIIRTFLILVLGMTTVFGTFTNNNKLAMAGSSQVAVLSPEVSVSGSSINEGDFIVAGGVYAKDGKLIFDDKCSVNASLFAKTKINNLKKYGLTSMMEMSITLNITSIADGGKISIAFGLPNARSSVGSAILQRWL